MPLSACLQGWLPRSGLLYGVDYVVYQKHPAAMHSEYGVLLLPQAQHGQAAAAGAGVKAPTEGRGGGPGWNDLRISARLINQVGEGQVVRVGGS